jgi:hypothetical protein
MATITCDNAADSRPAIKLPGAGEIACFRGQVTLTTAQVANGNIVEFGVLPAGCVPVDVILDVGDLDSDGSPAITIDVGLDGSDVFMDGVTTGQAGGVARPTAVGAFRVAPSTSDRVVTAKLISPATAQGGIIGCNFFYRNARYGA